MNRGHSVEVLRRIYAKCLNGRDDIAKRRITETLREGTYATEEPGRQRGEVRSGEQLQDDQQPAA